MRLDHGHGAEYATGPRADLAVLDAGPLLDVSHLRRIEAVFPGGRRLDPGALMEPEQP